MTILHLVSTFPPYHGGMGNVVSALAKELAREGEDVTVLTPSYDGGVYDEIVEGVRVVKLRSLLAIGNAAVSPRILRWMFRYDIVHLHVPSIGGSEWVLVGLFLRWLRRRKKPVVIVQYHMDLVGRGWKAFVFQVYQTIVHRALLRFADKVVVTSMDYARSSRELAPFLRHAPQTIAAIPLGVDTTIFQPQNPDPSFLRQWAVALPALIILFVGSLDDAHYFKGLSVLLEAFPTVVATRGPQQPVHCLIVGAGDRLRWYEDRVANMGFQHCIHFLGGVQQSMLATLYALSDVVVLPSIDRSEAFGLVLLEAMACARSVIATNLPGVRMVVEDGITGRIVRPGDVPALTQALLDLLEDPVLRAQMGERGREKMLQNYQWPKIAGEWRSLYQQLLASLV